MQAHKHSADTENALEYQKMLNYTHTIETTKGTTGGISMEEIATKEQERKALTQIRKIVEGLGPQSYIATAMTGVFDLAEQNIEYDAALEFPEQIDSLQKQLSEAQQIAKKASADYEAAHQERNRLQAAHGEACEAITERDRKIADLTDHLKEEHDLRAGAEVMVQRRNEKIVKLKARLYDLLVAGEKTT